MSNRNEKKMLTSYLDALVEIFPRPELIVWKSLTDDQDRSLNSWNIAYFQAISYIEVSLGWNTRKHFWIRRSNTIRLRIFDKYWTSIAIDWSSSLSWLWFEFFSPIDDTGVLRLTTPLSASSVNDDSGFNWVCWFGVLKQNLFSIGPFMLKKINLKLSEFGVLYYLNKRSIFIEQS